MTKTSMTRESARKSGLSDYANQSGGQTMLRHGSFLGHPGNCIGVAVASGGPRELWAWQGLNLRPSGYEPPALPLSYRPIFQ